MIYAVSSYVNTANLQFKIRLPGKIQTGGELRHGISSDIEKKKECENSRVEEIKRWYFQG